MCEGQKWLATGCPVWVWNEQGCTPVEGVVRELGMDSLCGWGRPPCQHSTAGTLLQTLGRLPLSFNAP